MSTSAVGTRTQISRKELFTKKANTLEGLRALLNDGLDPNATMIAEDTPPEKRVQYLPNEGWVASNQLHFYNNSRTLLAWVIKFSNELEPSLELLIKMGAKNPFRRLAESISFRFIDGDGSHYFVRDHVRTIKSFKSLISLKCDIKEASFFPIIFLLLAIQDDCYEMTPFYELSNLVISLVDAGADIPIEFLRKMESDFKEVENFSKHEEFRSSSVLLKLELFDLCKLINERIQEKNKESSAARGAGDAKSQAEPSGEADTKQGKDRDDGALERERKELKEALAYLETQKRENELAKKLDFRMKDKEKDKGKVRARLRPNPLNWPRSWHGSPKS